MKRRSGGRLAALLAAFVGFTVNVAPVSAAAAPEISGATRIDREYIAFRDDNNRAYQNTLWVQDVTACKADAAECSESGNGLNSRSYSVAYCLNQHMDMPYNLADKSKKISWDGKTGLWTNAQKFWRFEPSDRLIRDRVKHATGQDANLRAIKKVLYYGYHDADDSKWQTENKISDIEFREGTQYALWHYTDAMAAFPSWPNQNVKKVFEYLVDAGNRLPDAPLGYHVNFYHTDENNNSYQDLVSVSSVPPESRPEPKKTSITLKKFIQNTNQSLEGVTVRVWAKSKTPNDTSVLFDKDYVIKNDEDTRIELEADAHYTIEEKAVPEGYEKRTFELDVDKDGKVTLSGANKEHAELTPDPLDENGFALHSTLKLYNTTEAKLMTTVTAGTSTATQDTPASVNPGKVRVTDKVDYKGLTEGKTYTLTGSLMKVVDGKPQLVKEAAAKLTIEKGKPDGTATIDFGETELEAGAKYVVFEKAESEDAFLNNGRDKHVVRHEDPDDRAQTVTVRRVYGIKTKVSIDGENASEAQKLEKTVTDEQLAAGLTVRDTVSYKGLDPEKEYKLIGVLHRVEADGSVTPLSAVKSMTFKPNRSMSETEFAPKAIMFLDFKSVKGLEVGKDYVVYEYLFHSDDVLTTGDSDKNISEADKEKASAKHEDPKDLSQTFLLKKEESTTTTTTTVTTTTTTMPTEPTGETTTTTTPTEPTGETTTTTTPTEPTGETTTTTTTTVPTEPTGETTTTTVPTEPTGETTTTTTPTEPTGETTTTTMPTEPTDGTTTTTTPTEPTDGTTTTTTPTEPTDGTTTTTPAETTTTTQPTTSTTVPEERQPGIKTTVEIDGATANEAAKLEKTVSADQLAAGIHVTDRVSYKGLDPAKEYKLVGVLHRVEKDGSLTPIALAKSGNFTPNAAMSPNQYTADAMEKLDFGAVRGLEPGFDYVVYEYLFTSDVTLTTPDGEKDLGEEDKAKASEKHENPKDLSQTFVLKTEEETSTTTETTSSTTAPSETTTVTEPTSSTTAPSETTTVTEPTSSTTAPSETTTVTEPTVSVTTQPGDSSSTTVPAPTSPSKPTSPGGGGNRPKVPQTGEHDENIALAAILLFSSIAVLVIRKKHCEQK